MLSDILHNEVVRQLAVNLVLSVGAIVVGALASKAGILGVIGKAVKKVIDLLSANVQHK